MAETQVFAHRSAISAHEKELRQEPEKGKQMNELKFYPSNKADAIAYIYTEKQAEKGYSPEELVDIYNDAYDRIIKKMNQIPTGRPKTGF